VLLFCIIADEFCWLLQEQQLASFQQLEQAEEQLSAMKSKQPTSNRFEQLDMQERLLRAEEEVEHAAAAARLASDRCGLPEHCSTDTLD